MPLLWMRQRPWHVPSCHTPVVCPTWLSLLSIINAGPPSPGPLSLSSTSLSSNALLPPLLAPVHGCSPPILLSSISQGREVISSPLLWHCCSHCLCCHQGNHCHQPVVDMSSLSHLFTYHPAVAVAATVAIVMAVVITSHTLQGCVPPMAFFLPSDPHNKNTKDNGIATRAGQRRWLSLSWVASIYSRHVYKNKVCMHHFVREKVASMYTAVETHRQIFH